MSNTFKVGDRVFLPYPKGAVGTIIQDNEYTVREDSSGYPYNYSGSQLKLVNKSSTVVEDKLTPEDREYLESWRDCAITGDFQSRGRMTKRLVSIIDKIAPKPVVIDLVPGNTAIADMLTRKEAVYQNSNTLENLNFDKGTFFASKETGTSIVTKWRRIDLQTEDYLAEYMKIS
jgi:hypothetical protein